MYIFTIMAYLYIVYNYIYLHIIHISKYIHVCTTIWIHPWLCKVAVGLAKCLYHCFLGYGELVQQQDFENLPAVRPRFLFISYVVLNGKIPLNWLPDAQATEPATWRSWNITFWQVSTRKCPKTIGWMVETHNTTSKPQSRWISPKPPLLLYLRSILLV